MLESGSNLFTNQTRISATRGKFGDRKLDKDTNLGYPRTLSISVKSARKENVEGRHCTWVEINFFEKNQVFKSFFGNLRVLRCQNQRFCLGSYHHCDKNSSSKISASRSENQSSEVSSKISTSRIQNQPKIGFIVTRRSI